MYNIKKQFIIVGFFILIKFNKMSFRSMPSIVILHFLHLA